MSAEPAHNALQHALSGPHAGVSVPSSRTLINPADLHGLAVPDREWIVPDWLPVGSLTLLYGDGGTGKSLLAMQLMTASATRTRWAGLDVLPCRSVGLFCEDDPAELHRRQVSINRHAGVDFLKLTDTRWMSGVGQDNLLVTIDKSGRANPTEFFGRFSEAVIEFGARLVIVDTAADTFGGNENVRAEVRQFIGVHLTSLAQRVNGAVLLTAHPSRSGMAAGGDLDGGSTAWSNSARTRWSFARPPADSDGAADEDSRILTRRKSNYSKKGEEISLHWSNGVFVSAGVSDCGTKVMHNADYVFLQLLDKCTDSNINLSHNSRASNYAPKVMGRRPDRQGFNKRDFERALNNLLAAKEITLEDYGRASDSRQRLVRVRGMPF